MSTAQLETITKEELLKKMKEGKVQVVNVLDPEWYKLGIIQGSMRIPLDALDQRLSELDRSREVVTYCANTQCTASSEAAKKLAKEGFKVRAYEGGIKEWKEAGLPTEEVKSVQKSEGSCCGGSCG